MISPSEIYGELREDVHLAGYAFERGCKRLKTLLSEGSWKECGSGFNDVVAFLDSLGLEKLRQQTEERREIAFPGASNIRSVAFTPDGRTLAASGGSATSGPVAPEW